MVKSTRDGMGGMGEGGGGNGSSGNKTELEKENTTNVTDSLFDYNVPPASAYTAIGSHDFGQQHMMEATESM